MKTLLHTIMIASILVGYAFPHLIIMCITMLLFSGALRLRVEYIDIEEEE